MRKVTVVIVFICIFGFSSITFAGPYINTEFPPDQLITNCTPKNIRKDLMYIGKFKIKEDLYRVYYWYDTRAGISVRYWNVTKLDNNMWIFDDSKTVTNISVKKGLPQRRK